MLDNNLDTIINKTYIIDKTPLNEEKIKDLDKYHEIKEKVIGHTYLFKQDVQSVINSEFKDEELEEYKSKVIKILDNEENINYR